jgi:hypothetical protein
MASLFLGRSRKGEGKRQEGSSFFEKKEAKKLL